ncbi:hypothetical protein C8Q75DRAFT_806457 [Abortiporus biennis]|nr:hypothetical protein C8Q75DRAFT_806457 [Abortiporus biennis]
MAEGVQSDVVIREVTKDVWTFSRPFNIGRVPVGGRSTAIRLGSGSVWVLVSTRLTEETKAKLDELGDVKYIVAPNVFHHLFLKSYKDTYPNAKVIGVKGLNEKKRVEGWQLDGVFDASAPDEQHGFESFKNHDVAFYHKASKTVLGADLLFNLPGNEQYSKTDLSPNFPILTSVFQPATFFTRLFIWLKEGDREAMTRDAQKVASWDFDRYIPCHGDVIESGAKELWKSTYRRYF